MANYSTNEFRSGLKIIIDNDPCIIVENEFVKPGKGQAFNRVRIKNLKTGKIVDKTFKSGESVEAADVLDQEMQFLYADGEFWHFMVPDTFEQYAADATAVGDARDWISDGDMCAITLWNNSPLLVDPELRAYRAAGLRRGRVEALSPRLPLNAIRALRSGSASSPVSPAASGRTPR